MTRREEQAYNDGRNAYRAGHDLTACTRKATDQRARWREGYEYERRLDAAAKATPEELEKSRSLARDLKAWARETFRS